MTWTLAMPIEVWLAKSRQLAEVSRSLTYAMSADEVMQFIARQAASLLETERVVLLTKDVDGQFKIRASVGIAAEWTERRELSVGEPLDRHLENIFEGTENCSLVVPLVVGGQINGVLAVARDTMRVPQEEREFLLSALADQAAVAIEQVQQGVTAKFRERLIGIVSHDLRTPLSAISLLAQTLLRKKSNDPYVASIVPRILRSTERADRMIRDLLDYTQFRLGAEMHLQTGKVRMADVVTRCIEEIEQVHPNRQFIVTQRGDPCGLWDGDRLEQALTNLLVNALTYSGKDTQIRINTWQEEATVCTSVHNEGEPIAPEQLPHIFEPMQRGTSAVNPSHSVGLGLYIVKNIVVAHAGSLAVKSAPAHGTTFTVRLPSRMETGTPLA